MTEIEFLSTLQNSLAGELPEGEIQSNVEYYREYISGERMKGRSEEDIFAELGEPYIISRTILDSYERTNPDMMHHTIIDEEPKEESYSGSAPAAKEPGLLKKIINVAVFALVVFLIIWIGGAVLSIALRFLLPILVVVWIVSMFKNRS